MGHGGVALRQTDHHCCAQVRGYIDSALWIDAEPLGHHLASGDEHVGFYGFADVTKGVASFANVTHLGAECAARWGGAEQWRCLFGEYRLPLVRTPYMAIGSQFDTYQMDNDFGTCGHWGCYPHTPAEVQYAWGLANRTADLARALAVGQRFLYSSRCHRHAVSLSTWQFVMPGCGGLSLQAALRTPLDSNPPPPTFGTGAACCRNKCGLLLLTCLRGPPRRRSQFVSWSSRASCRRCGSSRSARSSAAAAAPPPVEDAPPARSALAMPGRPKEGVRARPLTADTPPPPSPAPPPVPPLGPSAWTFAAWG